MQKWIIYDKVNGVSITIFRNIIPVAPTFDVTYGTYRYIRFDRRTRISFRE